MVDVGASAHSTIGRTVSRWSQWFVFQPCMMIIGRVVCSGCLEPEQLAGLRGRSSFSFAFARWRENTQKTHREPRQGV